MEAHRARMQEDLLATRAQAEQHHVPVQVLRTRRHHDEYEFRRGDPEAMTLTKLTARRRQERIEHNLANFSNVPPEPARFSDQEKPWWTMRDGYCPDPPSSLLRDLRYAPEKVTGKVTETEPPRPRVEADAAVPPPAPPVSGEVFEASMAELAKTRFRRCAGFLAPSLQTKVPRIFDKAHPALEFATDYDPMYKFSSFEVIREMGAREEAERKRKAAMEEYAKMESLAEPAVSPEQEASAESSAKTQKPSKIQITRLELPARRLGAPTGEDLPMTERLELLTSKSSPREETAGHKTSKASSRSASVMSTGRRRPSDATVINPPQTVRSRAPSFVMSVPPSIPPSVPTPQPQPQPSQMVVRSSAFQWLDRTGATRRLEEPSKTPSMTRKITQGSSREFGSEAPRSRSQSRVLQDLSSEAALSRAASRAQV